MGVLDSLLGLKTAGATNAAVAGSTDSINNNAQYATDVLRGTTNRANSALTTGAQGATGALTSNYGSALDALRSYGGQAASALTNGVNTAANTVQGSNANYSPYLSSGGAASTMFGDALGLNGAAGSDAARAAFTSSPGYTYQVDQATDAAARKAASLGMSASGNTLDAITRLGSNLANQNWGSWLTNLQGASGQGLSAANSVSGNNQSAAGYQYGGGGALSSLYGNLGSGTANLYQGLGTGLAGVSTGLGQGLSGNLTGLGTNVANTNMGAALADAKISMDAANATDTANSANNGIFSSLLGKAIAPEVSTLSSSVAGGLKGLTGGFL